MKLKELIDKGFVGFDLGDKTYDWLNYFEYDTEISDEYDKCLCWIASELDVDKIVDKDRVCCDICGFIKKNWKLIQDYTKKFWKKEFIINEPYEAYAADERDYDVVMNSWFGHLLNGNVSESSYKWINDYVQKRSKKI